MHFPFFNSQKRAENRPLTRKEKAFVAKVATFEEKFASWPDEKLKNKTIEFRERLAEIRARLGREASKEEIIKAEDNFLEEILEEAFGLVRVAAKRTLGERHYDVQLLGGKVLHEGKIAEMKTGEGKTLVASLALYLNALPGRGVHLVTVNDYLSRRDAGWMGPIYHLLGLSVAAIGHETSLLYDPTAKDGDHADERLLHFRRISRKEAYMADITYGTNNEFGFDYLRDNMAISLDQCVQRDLNFAIVDEVDSILIDEARTPLIISRPAEESTSLYEKFAQFVPKLKPSEDYIVDEKEKHVAITPSGIAKMEQFLGVKNLYEAQSAILAHHLEEALRAHALFKRDRDYVVKDGEIVIVDEFTGRLMPGRRYSEGLHQALEAKEGLRVQQESDTLATISFQNFFRLYRKLAGMTGTAKTEEEEFWKIYGLEVVVIPTNRPMIRVDLPDKVYKTEEAKWQAIVDDIEERHKKGQPLLVGTVSIEKNEMLSLRLRRRGIKHEVLNAKNHEREAAIIAKAGKVGAVTVATNMAGRGTDIKVEREALKLGGLHVIGTERHEARRIDNQLRGRTGRQGDPGSTQFYVSLEDDLMRLFGGEQVKRLMTLLRVPENVPIESKMVSRAIEAAQKKVEGYNFDIRKHVVEYDDVMNKHRTKIYGERRQILEGKDLKERILKILEEELEKLWQIYSQQPDGVKRFTAEINAISGKEFSSLNSLEEAKEALLRAYKEKETKLGEPMMREFERLVMLQAIDMLWVEHLNSMEALRHSVGLVGYSQKDPLVEYKYKAFQLFKELTEGIKRLTLELLFKAELGAYYMPMTGAVEQGPSEELTAGAITTHQGLNGKGDLNSLSGGAPYNFQDTTAEGVKISIYSKNQTRPSNFSSSVNQKSSKKHPGRNDPCPCGSGKKYKRCCAPKFG